MLYSRTLTAAAVLALAGAAYARPASPTGDPVRPGDVVRITLANGDSVTGIFAGKDPVTGDVTLNHPSLGTLVLPKDAVAAVIAAAAPAAEPVVTTQPADPPSAPTAPPAPPPDPTSWAEGWNWSAELGLNGSEGNTERLNVRAGLGGERKTTKIETSVKFSYSYAKDASDTTENRFIADLRNDWLTDSKWRYFATAKYEYDEFQDWDQRLSAFVGVGYEFINNEKTLLLGRLGIGGSKEIGGDDDAIRPELDIGGDFKHKFDDRQSIFASVDYYPDLSEFTTFRLVSKAGYEVVVNPESKMSLKLGIEDRYDSDVPAGTKKNDIDYFALMVWSF